MSCRRLSRYHVIGRASRRGQHNKRGQAWGEPIDQRGGDGSNAGGLSDSGLVETCEGSAAKLEEFSRALRRAGYIGAPQARYAHRYTGGESC